MAASIKVYARPWITVLNVSRRLSATLILAEIGQGLVPAATALLMKQILDHATAGGSSNTALLSLVSYLTLVSLVAVALSFLKSIVSNRLKIGALSNYDLRLVAEATGTDGVQDLESPAFLEDMEVAANAGHYAISSTVDTLAALTRIAVTLSSFSIVLFLSHPVLALIAIAASIPQGVIQYRASRRMVELQSEAGRLQRIRAIHRTALLDVRAGREMRIYDSRSWLLARYRNALRAAESQEMKLDLVGSRLTASGEVIGLVVTGIAVAVTAVRVQAGAASVGDIALVSAATAALFGALAALVGIGGSIFESGHQQGLRDGLSDRLSMSSFGDVEPGPLEILELKDVWFRYREDGPWVLKGVSFSVSRGQALGLVGENGSGKSTIVKLILGLYQPNHGEILWNGSPLSSLNISSVRQRMSAVFQDFMCYDLTVAENISISNVTQSDREELILQAAGLAGVDVERSFPQNGLEQVVSRQIAGDGKSQYLSGGQWQRLANARFFFRAGVDLVILDEPNSSLDPLAEHRLRKRVVSQSADKASISVSHRLSALRSCTCIIVIRDGRVVEAGTHAELVEDPHGLYAELFSAQAEGYRDDQ